MNKKNLLGLTIIGFLSYFLTGAMIVVTGIVIHNLAQYFHLSIAKMSNAFTFLNAGILVAIFLNSRITQCISLKKQIIMGFFLIIISVLGFIQSNNLMLFCSNMFILGIVGGITMSIGTFLITNIYSGKERTSKLLITDSFFSMSGMIFPVLASYLLSHKILWYWIYIIISIIYFIIFLITLNVKFPKINNNIINQQTIESKKYKINIFILCCSALCYILGQLGFISWVPEYTTQNIKQDIQSAGNLVSNFWMSYMFGMWCFSYILTFFDLQKSITVLSGISTFLMYLFIHNTYLPILKIIIIFLGFFSSAIYTIIITLTSLQTQQPSQKLINNVLMFGTIGTLLTFIITGPVVSTMGIYGALIFCNILYGIVFILSGILKFTSNHKKNL
ncbi:MFS transporter TsgA [Buchnera aphidicola]|uniref:MFS transporter TsgA n=1 Tax=Buchnera aphidicola TaxID=9 RepID=UPI003463F528